MKRKNYVVPTDWNALLQSFFKDFEAESDRGCVLLAGALLESTLEDMLASRLALPLEKPKKDPFFRTGGPGETFSARIELAYRMGLITELFYRSLHTVRELRNHFAHWGARCDLDDSHVKDCIQALRRSVVVAPTRGPDPHKTVRDEFLSTVSILLAELGLIRQNQIKRIDPKIWHLISMPKKGAKGTGKFKF